MNTLDDVVDPYVGDDTNNQIVLTVNESTTTTTTTTEVDSNSTKQKNKKVPQSRPPLQLEWKNVEFKVKAKATVPKDVKGFERIRYLFKKEQRTILFPMSGHVSPGSVLAIMGPSGAGKTSLLNILAQRVKHTGGEITMNGQAAGKAFRALSAFVQQDDVLMGNLTVRECLRYAAWLRLDSSIPWAEKQKRIDTIADELGLTKCMDAVVGIPGMKKGISGGERKRLAIGIELLTEPSILFLDEPTSGLDAKTAQNVMETIGKLAKNGRAVVLTIHQPRSNIFKMFDKLLLLARGRIAYFGPAKDASAYFGAIPTLDPADPLMFKCPSDFNPSDFFIDLITETTSLTKAGKEQKHLDNKRINFILDYYEKNSNYELPAIDSSMPTNFKKFSAYRSSWFIQIFVLFIRSFTNILRDRVLTFARAFQSIVMALIIGLIFLRLGKAQKDVQSRIGAIFFILMQTIMGNLFGSMMVFLTQERPVFMRERGAKTYRVSSYYLAKMFAEIPHSMVFSIILATIAYWMVGLNPDPRRFFTFLLIVICLALIAQSLGALLGSLAPSLEAAMALGPVILTLLMLFAGFYIKVDNIPPWFIWIYWISLFHFGYEGLVLNEFAGQKFVCPAAPAPCAFDTGTTLIKSLGMQGKVNNKWIDVGFLLAYTIILRVIAYLVLRFLRKPRGG
jgi:ABC-type multidrug transport system ATPase subunit/ABC-type multidrug transport system permease subunit